MAGTILCRVEEKGDLMMRQVDKSLDLSGETCFEWPIISNNLI
jgi:hypothetical protein